MTHEELHGPGCGVGIQVVYYGQPGWLSGLALPSAQGVILETQNQVPHWASCMEAAFPSACVSASLSVSLMNKYIKSLEINKDLFGAAE